MWYNNGMNSCAIIEWIHEENLFCWMYFHFQSFLNMVIVWLAHMTRTPETWCLPYIIMMVADVLALYRCQAISNQHTECYFCLQNPYNTVLTQYSYKAEAIFSSGASPLFNTSPRTHQPEKIISMVSDLTWLHGYYYTLPEISRFLASLGVVLS